MSFVYEDEMLELNYKGEVYKFRQPSAVEQSAIGKKFREATEDQDGIQMYIEFFKSLGLPEDVLSKMSTKGLMDLFSYCLGTKKN